MVPSRIIIYVCVSHESQIVHMLFQNNLFAYNWNEDRWIYICDGTYGFPYRNIQSIQKSLF